MHLRVNPGTPAVVHLKQKLTFTYFTDALIQGNFQGHLSGN